MKGRGRVNDSLGDRMKASYEHRTRTYLPRRTYTIVRVDGKAFHSYCRGLARPFDATFAEDMDLTAKALCEEMQGACLAFVQSDEISVLLTDFGKDDTEAWFDGNLQKIVSIAASCATATLNQLRYHDVQKLAMFDARAFTIPDPVEVENYFIWRQQDATRNSISMAAQAKFSPKELHGQDSGAMQEMLFAKGINWNDYPVGFRRGRAIHRVVRLGDVAYTDRRTGELRVAPGVMRASWEVAEPPVFTQDRAWLQALIPRHCSGGHDER